MNLDCLAPAFYHIGYGRLGIGGDLGYEGKAVVVQGKPYAHALSTHPPARVHFRLGGQYSGFECSVALNDDVPPGASHADFVVLADGKEIAFAAQVHAGEAPRALRGPVAGAEFIDLVVRTARWEFCHAVWLDPRLEGGLGPASARTVTDCLGRADIDVPRVRPHSRRCIATVVSPGFECFLDDLLGSLYSNANCQDAVIAVFMLNGNDACRRIAAKYGAEVIEGRSRAHVNPMSKALLYSAALFVDAEQFVCLDADMLVLDDLNPVFAALDVCPPGSILACREGNGSRFSRLADAFRVIYYANERDFQALGVALEEGAYPLVVNDGLFAASRHALLDLDATVRAMDGAARWADARGDCWWRNQFIFNLALARLQCGVEIDSIYNVQLHVQDVHVRQQGARLLADWRGRGVRVLHFSGIGKRKYLEWRGRFASVPDPVTGPGGGDGYADFVRALRLWTARYGTRVLTWSFYGRTDGVSAEVRDPSTFPLLATLHYLVRSNGCVRVVETGTARGVSAACLASAVAHRAGARVLSLDPNHYPERDDLWAALPARMRECIVPQQVGGLEGMAAEIDAGRVYDAVLLDSIHDKDHVWAEFQLAVRLVRTHGLILIHDPLYAGGTVPAALERIESAGYGVVRLWAADTGACEDDRLGLAVIENRRQGSAL